MTSPSVAGAALALGGAIVLGAATAPWVLICAVLLVQGLLVAGWHHALDVPGRAGGAVVAGLAALAADLLVARGDGASTVSAVPAVLALAVLGSLVHQLARRDGRTRVNASLSATVSLAALAGLAATGLAVEELDAGVRLVELAAVTVALVVSVAVARRRLGGPSWLEPVLVAAVCGLAALVGAAVSDLRAGPALAVAAAAGGAAWVAVLVVAQAASPRAAVAAALPYALALPVVYLVGRLLAA